MVGREYLWGLVEYGRAWLVPTIVLGGIFLIAALIIMQNPGLSPYDEEVHLDYVDKIGRLEVPRPNSLMDQTSLRAEACRGFYGPYQPPALCSLPGQLDPTLFQFGGVSRASIHPPIYYAVTRLLMLPFQAVPRAFDFVDAARMATALWMVAAGFLLWATLRRFRVHEATIAGVVAILFLNPNVMQRAVTVTNDASGIFVGALLAYLVLTGRGRAALFVGAALAILLKVQNVIVFTGIIPMCLLGAYGAAGAFQNTDLSTRIRRGIGATLAMLAGVLAAFVVWQLARPRTTGSTAVDAITGGGSAGLPSIQAQWHLAVDNVVSFAFPFYEPWVGFLPVYEGARSFIVMDLWVTTLFLGAAATSLLLYRFANPRFSVALGTLMAQFLGPALLAIGIGVVLGTWQLWPKRYGLAVVPLFALPVAFVSKTMLARSILLVTAAVYVILTLERLISNT